MSNCKEQIRRYKSEQGGYSLICGENKHVSEHKHQVPRTDFVPQTNMSFSLSMVCHSAGVLDY